MIYEMHQKFLQQMRYLHMQAVKMIFSSKTITISTLTIILSICQLYLTQSFLITSRSISGTGGTYIIPSNTGTTSSKSLPFNQCIFLSSTEKSTIILHESNNEMNPFEGFNPFEKKSVKNLNPLISSMNNISVRKLRMKELMTTLLDNVSCDDDNNDRLVSILDNNSEILLEPLIDDDAVIEKDSIYDPGMNREERFIRYDEIMGQRIDKAMNKSVKKVLIVMREYVMNQR